MNAKQKQEMVRGIVKYATVWNEVTSSAPAQVAAYILTSGIGVKHSDIESVLHRALGDMSVVDAAVVSATFGLELDQDKITCPLNAFDVLKENGVREEDITDTPVNGAKMCDYADTFFANKLVCLVRDALEKGRCS